MLVLLSLLSLVGAARAEDPSGSASSDGTGAAPPDGGTSSSSAPAPSGGTPASPAPSGGTPAPAPPASPTAGTAASSLSAPPPVLSPAELEAAAQDAPPPPLTAAELGAAAETSEPLSRRMLRMLKPSPGHLPQNPRGQVDFTAYTLEWGEVKLGLANMTVGLLPHVQVGTSVPLDVIGLPNVTGKVHATEGGPFDIGAYGSYYVLSKPAVDASFLGVGGITSLRLAEPWSLHVGGGYSRAEAAGTLDFATVGDIVAAQGFDVGDVPPTTVGVLGEAATARIATDVRLNRRDSIILQAQAIVWARTVASGDEAVRDFLNLDEVFDQNGMVPLGDALSASLAWHFAWKHWEARIGAGWSSVPGAWLLQSTELSYRFGGKTRRREHRQMESWKRNKDAATSQEAEPQTDGK